MLRVLAKPFTGLQMTQLGGELQGLFAPCSNLHFYPKASVQPVLLPVPTYCCTTVLPVPPYSLYHRVARIVARAEQTRLSDPALCLIPAVVDLLPKSANQPGQEIGNQAEIGTFRPEICMYQ